MSLKVTARPSSVLLPTAAPVAKTSNAVKPSAVDGFETAARAPAFAAPATASVIPSRFELGAVPYVPNGFTVSTSGAFPPVPAGSFWTKLHQGALTAENSLKAEESIQSGGRSPSDADVASQLRGLHVTSMYSSVKATHADYTSTIPHCDPSTAYNAFVKNPGAVFGAGGLTVRPATSQLQDGQRLMLQAPGTPPLWMPIEVHLDPANNAIHIKTLDGHPFRGTNDFQFVSDGKGGTTIAQKSAFQGSSDLIKTAGAGQLQMQHETWKGVHELLYTQCAGSNELPTGNAVHVASSPNLSIPAWDTTADQLYVKSTDTIHSAQVSLDIANVDPRHLQAYLTNDAGQIVRLGNFTSNGHGGVTGTFDIGATLKGQSAKGYWTLYVGGGGYSSNGVLKSWSLDINKAGSAAA